MMPYVLLSLYVIACVADVLLTSAYSRALVRVMAVAMYAYIISICMYCGGGR